VDNQKGAWRKNTPLGHVHKYKVESKRYIALKLHGCVEYTFYDNRADRKDQQRAFWAVYQNSPPELPVLV